MLITFFFFFIKYHPSKNLDKCCFKCYTIEMKLNDVYFFNFMIKFYRSYRYQTFLSFQIENNYDNMKLQKKER